MVCAKDLTVPVDATALMRGLMAGHGMECGEERIDQIMAFIASQSSMPALEHSQPRGVSDQGNALIDTQMAEFPHGCRSASGFPVGVQFWIGVHLQPCNRGGQWSASRGGGATDVDNTWPGEARQKRTEAEMELIISQKRLKSSVAV